jgi:uridine phosphorylase
MWTLKPGDLAPTVLLPGDPGRVPIIAEYWDEAHKCLEHREYVIYTGTYKGVPISCASTGMGCPSTAILMERLARCDVTTFLRVGTCGGLQRDIKTGDIVVCDSAARYDGTSVHYAPLEFPAAAHYEVINACIETCQNSGHPFHVGTTRTADTFFARHPKPGASFNNYWQSSWAHFFEDLSRMNIAAAEMEASIVFVLARLWGLRAGAIAVVVDNMLDVCFKEEDFDPDEDLDHSPEHIENLSRIGCEIVYNLHQNDQNR